MIGTKHMLPTKRTALYWRALGWQILETCIDDREDAAHAQAEREASCQELAVGGDEDTREQAQAIADHHYRQPPPAEAIGQNRFCAT